MSPGLIREMKDFSITLLASRVCEPLLETRQKGTKKDAPKIIRVDSLGLEDYLDVLGYKDWSVQARLEQTSPL